MYILIFHLNPLLYHFQQAQHPAPQHPGPREVFFRRHASCGPDFFALCTKTCTTSAVTAKAAESHDRQSNDQPCPRLKSCMTSQSMKDEYINRKTGWALKSLEFSLPKKKRSFSRLGGKCRLWGKQTIHQINISTAAPTWITQKSSPKNKWASPRSLLLLVHGHCKKSVPPMAEIRFTTGVSGKILILKKENHQSHRSKSTVRNWFFADLLPWHCWVPTMFTWVNLSWTPSVFFASVYENHINQSIRQ